MLGQLLDQDKHHHKQLQRDIFLNGEPSSLMAELGFDGNAKFYPQSYQDEKDLPIFVLPLHSNQMEDYFAFLVTFRKYFPGRILIIYNIGLSEEHYKLVNKLKLHVYHISHVMNEAT